jgi:hypothetical protein
LGAYSSENKYFLTSLINAALDHPKVADTHFSREFQFGVEEKFQTWPPPYDQLGQEAHSILIEDHHALD